MAPTFFSTQQQFRQWLSRHHKKEVELLVGFYKVGSGKASITWPQSVDEALCFGWIDGIRKSIDNESYSIRFTPRKPGSIWSVVNIKKIAQLKEAGLMKPEGLEAFELKTEKRTAVYSHENEAKQLSTAYTKQFKANKAAWKFFNAQAPSYQKVMIHWIMTAKLEKTQCSRLEKTIAISEVQKRML